MLLLERIVGLFRSGMPAKPRFHLPPVDLFTLTFPVCFWVMSLTPCVVDDAVFLRLSTFVSVVVMQRIEHDLAETDADLEQWMTTSTSSIEGLANWNGSSR